MTEMRIIFTICLLSLFSCSTLKQVEKNTNQSSLNDKNFSNINGDYDIFTTDTATTTLDLALTLEKYWWFDRKENYKLSLKVIDNRHLQTDIYKNDSLITTKILTGKLQNDFFVIKKTKILFFYFLINGFGNLTTRIGQLKSGELLIDSHTFKVATLIIIPLTGDRVEQYGLVFPKKNANRIIE